MRLRYALASIGVAVVMAASAACGSDAQDVQNRSSQAADAGTVSVPTYSAGNAGQQAIDPPAGWADQVAKLPANSGKVTNGGAWLQVVGDCSSNGNAGMLLNGGGFPANGSYRGQVFGPDGSRYAYFDGNGRFDSMGQPSSWKWNCYVVSGGSRDQAGTYRLEFKDVTPGSPTENVPFVVAFSVGY